MADSDSSVLYSELPAVVNQDIEKILPQKKEGLKKGELFNKFLMKNAPISRHKEIKDLTHRVFFLQSKTHQKKFNRKQAARKKLTSKEKKKLKLFQIPKEQKFESFIPLHKLWHHYFRDVIDFSKMNDKGLIETQQKLLKADYHGALVTVTKSKTPSLIGKTGIIVQETKNVFKIVCKDDKVKIIPKQNSVFTFEVEGYVFRINGNQFCFGPAERVGRKFKFKPPTPKDMIA